MVVVSQGLSFSGRSPWTSRSPASCPAEAELPTSYSVPLHDVSYAAAKRAADITIALFLLTAGAVGLAAIALLVKLSSRGPVIFKQTRVGEGGRPFTFYKFRSMYADAEARRAELETLNEASGPVFKMKNDPRITPVGRILRKFSLDELPQLYNVVIGNMSVVGPRPAIVAEVRQYGPKERQRLGVKPGLTCLWQISGRSDVQFDQWMDLDISYIQTMSFWSDLRIFFQTIPAVMTARGAR